ncbi:MAG TPA: CDP-alcohol phosphatidyltransferase family protein [Granulicella sp.]
MPLLDQLRAAPNLFTLLRLFMLPFLVIAILDGQYRIAFGLFVLAGLSDAVDGILARWLNQQTTLGQYLDPIADKLLLSTLFVTLTYIGLIPRYVTVLVFCRDISILLIATLLFAISILRSFRPSLFGKLNTVVQVITVTSVLLAQVVSSSALTTLNEILIRLVAVVAPVSAAEYGYIILKRVSAYEAETAAHKHDTSSS